MVCWVECDGHIDGGRWGSDEVGVCSVSIEGKAL